MTHLNHITYATAHDSTFEDKPGIEVGRLLAKGRGGIQPKN